MWQVLRRLLELLAACGPSTSPTSDWKQLVCEWQALHGLLDGERHLHVLRHASVCQAQVVANFLASNCQADATHMIWHLVQVTEKFSNPSSPVDLRCAAVDAIRASQLLVVGCILLCAEKRNDCECYSERDCIAHSFNETLLHVH